MDFHPDFPILIIKSAVINLGIENMIEDEIENIIKDEGIAFKEEDVLDVRVVEANKGLEASFSTEVKRNRAEIDYKDIA